MVSLLVFFVCIGYLLFIMFMIHYTVRVSKLGVVFITI